MWLSVAKIVCYRAVTEDVGLGAAISWWNPPISLVEILRNFCFKKLRKFDWQVRWWCGWPVLFGICKRCCALLHGCCMLLSCTIVVDAYLFGAEFFPVCCYCFFEFALAKLVLYFLLVVVLHFHHVSISVLHNCLFVFSLVCFLLFWIIYETTCLLCFLQSFCSIICWFSWQITHFALFVVCRVLTVLLPRLKQLYRRFFFACATELYLFIHCVVQRTWHCYCIYFDSLLVV